MARGKKKESALTPEEKLAQALVPDWEWPYKVPENWCWTSFVSISQIRTGKKDANYGSEDGEYPFFTCAAEPIRCDGYSFNCNAILLAGNGDINNISRYEGKFEAYQRTYVVEVKEPINTDLLYYYFKYRWFDYNKDKMFGTAIPYIRLGNLQTFPIPLPPLEEQQRIVDRIEYLFAKLDEAKEKAQSVLDSFETRKAAILHKAFTGELTAKWRVEHSVVLGNWRQLTLSQCSSKIGDGLHGTPSFSDGGEYYFVNGNNFAGQHIEIKPETKRVSVAEYEKHKIHLFKDATVFVSINGTLGKTAFYNNEPVVLGKSACYVHVTDDLNKFFLRYYFETKEFIDYANTLATGSTIKNLGLKAMRNMPMSLPGVDEQIEIVRILDSLLAKEQQAKEAAEAVLEKIDLLKKSILAHAFRGELGTNDPTEESAQELLKTVL